MKAQTVTDEGRADEERGVSIESLAWPVYSAGNFRDGER